MEEFTIIGLVEPIEAEGLVEFRLIYEGDLPPSGNKNKRPKEKHAIRRVFHPQLRRLWELKPSLRQLAERKWVGSNERVTMSQQDVDALEVGYKGKDLYELGVKHIGKNWARAGYHLVPLITPEFALRCSLDVLLLRPSDKKFIFQQGDIDGQLKTLSDALRMPDNVEETGGSGPQADEDPFFCLLQNDNLITEVHVTTDELLSLPQQKQVRANDAFVLINVRLNSRNPGTFDRYFG